jgi:hypothetical protein
VRFNADHTTGKTAPGGANAGRSNWLYCGLVPRPAWRCAAQADNPWDAA